MRNPYDFEPDQSEQLQLMNVQKTNDDATACRYSCHALGYISDIYVEAFIPVHKRKTKPPLINRGTFFRCTAIDTEMKRLLTPDTQVISIGSGNDTRYFRMQDQQFKKYFEVDYQRVVQSKIKVIQKNGWLKDAQFDNDSINSSKYVICSGDLTDWPSVLVKLKQRGLDENKPIVLISEMVVSYLRPYQSSAIFNWLHQIKKSALIMYEAVQKDDPFGQIMVQNINARGLQLPGIFENLEQAKKSVPFKKVKVSDMLTISEQLDQQELQRIQKLEMLDELEEFNLLQAHYFVLVAEQN